MNNYRLITTFLISLFAFLQLSAQEYTNSQVIWNKSYSGNSQDDPHRIYESPDGNFLTVGITYSTQFDSITSIYETNNIWLIYTDPNGEIIWHNTYGGNLYELPTEAFFHENGDITIIGYSSSYDGDVQNHHGDFENYDIWIFTINSKGEILRSNCIGTEANEFCNYASQTSEGGYLLACGKEVMKDDIIYQTLIVKTDSLGIEEWSFQLDLDDYNVTEFVKQIAENEFLIMGYTVANIDGQLHYSEEFGGYPDYFAFVVDRNGNILKSKYFGGTRLEELKQVLESPDGGYLLLGQTESPDGDVTGYSWNEMYCSTCPDLWVLKISENFEIEWERAFGSYYEDYMGRGIINQKGNLVVIGTIMCAFGGIGYNPPFPISYDSEEYPVYYGYQDAWLVEFSPDGKVLKNLILGAYHNERGTDIIETNTNEYVFCAIAQVTNASGNRWDMSDSDNYWIVKASLCYPIDKPYFSYESDTLTSIGSYATYQWYDDDEIIDGATSNKYIIEKSGIYYLEVTNEDGCSAMSDGIDLIATGLDEFSEPNFSFTVLPNPNNGKFKLKFETRNSGEYDIQIFNELGQIQLQKSINIPLGSYEDKIDVSHYAHGNYIVKVTNGETINTKKIIIQ